MADGEQYLRVNFRYAARTAGGSGVNRLKTPVTEKLATLLYSVNRVAIITDVLPCTDNTLTALICHAHCSESVFIRASGHDTCPLLLPCNGKFLYRSLR